jgi:HAMP domain-containing protein
MWLLRSAGLRAHRTNPGEASTYRLASSIKLPWSIGVAALLVVAIATAALVGRTGESTLRVPAVVLDFQEQITRDAAQSVRRSLNEGVTDIDELARVVSAGRTTRRSDLQGLLSEFFRAQKRYTSVFAIDGRGAVVARVGKAPSRRERRAFVAGRPGVQEIPQPNGRPPLIQQFAPVTAAGSPARAVVGHYDPSIMQFPLEVSRPGYAWVVNRRGQAVGDRAARSRLGPLPRLTLRRAASRAIANTSGAQSLGGSIDAQEVVGYAPITGSGPAGQLGWGVVTTRSVKNFSLPQTEARRHAFLAGAVLAVLTILIFGWLYIVVISPVMRLQREAERVAYGDLTKNVDVVRYDEIGLTGRAIERLRIALIRARVRSSSERTGGTGPPGTEAARSNGKPKDPERAS